MPRFYIDTSDERAFHRDQQVMELPDVQAAKEAAVDALPDMARDVLPDGDHRMFLTIVRGEDGGPILQASLALNVVSLIPTSTE